MDESDWRGLRRTFPFRLATRLEYGEGVSLRVGDEAAAIGKRPLVVTDHGVEEAGIVQPVLDALTRSGLEPLVFDEVEGNPRSATIDRGASFARENEIDVIVGVGGGSSLDSAKAISAVHAHGGTIFDYEWDYDRGDMVPGPSTPVIAIPTTSGTGSEVTLWAIVTDLSRNYKMAIGSIHLSPRVALMDPLLTATMPPSVTAATGADALAHAIEGFTARCSNPISDGLCLYAIELISLHLERAVANGRDLEARSGMMLASVLAGIGFGNSDTTAVHSMGEALGGLLDLPHGLAIAICLPHVLRFNREAVPEKLARVGRAMALPVDGLELADAASFTVDSIGALLERVGIPPLSTVGVSEAEVPKLVTIALRNTGNPDNPMEVDEEVFTRLFTEALA